MSPRLKSADMSAHSKFCIATTSLQAITAAMNWPHGPAHWLFEPGLYICHRQHQSEIAAFEFTDAAGFLSGLLARMRERIRLELARLGSVGQSLPLRCGVAARSSDATEISREASDADGQTT